jgi:hypothetical protein
MPNQELGYVLLMNNWRDACELQQQKLNLILKHYSTKMVSDVSLLTDFVKIIG